MVKYVYDSKGKKTGVIIPIELWEKSKSRILEEKQQTNKDVFHPSKYRGLYRDMELDLTKEAPKLRDEWVRI
jgi:hypothetical protein